MPRPDRLITRLAAAGLLVLMATPLAAGEIAEKMITVMEKQLIADYYRKAGEQTRAATRDDTQSDQAGKSKAAKDKGSKAKKDMPKGIAMKLERGGTLPPGMEKRALPADLRQQLPQRSAGQELAVVDKNVVLVEKATGVILDILTDLGQR